MTKEKPYSKIDLELDFTKISFSKSNKSTDKYWKSGVGYGHGSRGKEDWDIKAYIKEKENSNIELTKILDKINDSINSKTKSENIFYSVLPTYLINQLRGSTLLDIQKNHPIYYSIFKILNSISKLSDVPQDFINIISEIVKVISDDVTSVINATESTEDDFMENLHMSIMCANDWYQSKKIVAEEKIACEIEESDKIKYINMTMKNQFGKYKFTPKHRYHSDKSKTLSAQSMIRVVSEISTLKKGLPCDWDSSILLRISESNMNMISFVITGPKDTPYHNGIFEFHAFFPPGYPNKVPKVLLDTTGGGSVRFNPNLYNCGKVCLSLLGTWNGDAGESWNKETSTFLQVMISIQSLILVDQPYFNEPGWERQMHTERGKKSSFDYNDNIRLQTITWAINDKIKNPVESYEEFTKEHFRMKKDELIEITNTWVNESKKYKSRMEDAREEMITLLNGLDKSAK